MKIFSYYINTIPAAAKDKLLKDSKPDYIKKYEKITEYLKPFKLGDVFVTFLDMCE